MANTSDPSGVFVSTISKEHDIVMGLLYSIFCTLTRPPSHIRSSFSWAVQPRIPVVAKCQAWLTHPRGPCRHPVPGGQLHSATGGVSQALDLEASRVLHHQSVHKWPRNDAVSVPAGHSVNLLTQVTTGSRLVFPSFSIGCEFDDEAASGMSSAPCDGTVDIKRIVCGSAKCSFKENYHFIYFVDK